MKRKKQAKRKQKKRRQASLPPEEQRTEAVTVAWMLSTLVTGGALCFGAIAWLIVSGIEGKLGALRGLPYLLLTIATITSAVALVLMGCTIRLRRTPPPRPVVIVATVICLAPWAALLLAALL